MRAVFFAALFAVTAAGAQDWPSKPIRWVVSFPPGGSVDLVSRILQSHVSEGLGQPILVENRGGAGGSVATSAVARAAPDGYTFLVTLSSHTINPLLYKLDYDVERDLAPVSLIMSVPQLIAVNPATAYKSMQDVIAASSKPGGIFYGTNGPGSSGHLFMEALRLAAGYPITHVPFRGTVEAMTEVIAGRIDMFPAPALNAINLTKEGKVNSLAVSSPKRLPLMAEVPTLAEVGLPKAQYQFWVGSFAPAKTPKSIVERLNREVVAALHVKETADKIIALGGSPMPMTPAEFDALVRREIALNGEIVKASGYQPQ